VVCPGWSVRGRGSRLHGGVSGVVCQGGCVRVVFQAWCVRGGLLGVVC
jgi:hypothetical protein